MRLNLPKPKLRIPPWSDASGKAWALIAARVNRVSETAGRSSDFEAVQRQIRLLMEQGRLQGLRDLMVRRIVARALSALWLEDEEFRRKSLTSTTLDFLIKGQKTLSALTFFNLVNLYFREFDRLDEPENGHGQVRQMLERILQAEVQKRRARRSNRPSPLTGLEAQPELVFGARAPRRLVERVQELGMELNAFLEAERLQVVGSGRFFDLCQAIYFLDTLKSIPVGSSHPVLNQLRDPVVNTAPFEDGRRIGHAALEIVIDRSGGDPSQEWLDFVVDIAGDPRVVGGRRFAQWWVPLGSMRVNIVRGWLSKVDIHIFLEALEDYSQSSARGDIRRMLPARKRFIEGLSEKGWLRQSRLVLGSTIEAALRNRLGDRMKRFQFARYPKPDTAIMIMDCTEFFVVEGSHSFKIWVYLANPAENILFNYSLKCITHSDLTTSTPAAYKERYPALPYSAIKHFPNLGWQHKVISFLASQGIRLDPEDVLTKEDYQAMLLQFSFPTVASRRTRIPEPKALPRRILRLSRRRGRHV